VDDGEQAEKDFDVYRAVLHDHVAEVVTSPQQPQKPLRGALVSGWYLVAEVVSLDGERYLELVASPDARHWQIMGWLGYACEETRLQVIDDIDEQG
jgi:hypothetical protein